MNKFFTAFTKITAYPMQFFCFRTKVYYEDRKVQGRRIKGPAIIISNHTAVYDYAVFLFVFFGRTLRYQMAEVLFEKKFLGPFLKAMGGIRVDRNTYNFSFIEKSEEILREGGVVGIFPESRLPRKDEERPLPFKPSAAFIAINCGVPVIPVYTNGSYFNSKRARVIIGKPINPSSYVDSSLSERENINKFTDVLRDKILELRDELTRQTQEK